MIPETSYEIREFVTNSLFSKGAKFVECKTTQQKNNTLIECVLGYDSKISKENFLIAKYRLISYLRGFLVEPQSILPKKVVVKTDYHYSVVLHHAKSVNITDYKRRLRQRQTMYFLTAAIYLF